MADQNYDNEYRQRVEEILKIESEINSSYNDRLSAAQRLQGVLADQEAAQNRLKRNISQFSRDEARQNAKAARYSGEAEAARQKGLKSLARQLQLKADLAGAAAKELSSSLEQYEAEDKLRRQEEVRLELNKSIVEKSKEQFKAISKTLSNAVGLNKVLQAFSLQSLISGLFEANDATYTLSKQFGTSLESARATREEYEEFAQTNNRIDFKRLVDAQISLGKAIGQNIEYSKEMAADFVEVTEYMGLSTQTAGKLAQVGVTLGQSAKEFRKGISDSLFPLNKSLGINTNIKDLYESIGNLSATTIINLQRQGPEMANLVQTAKRFGIEMQQISSFSESLLNFEQSIQNELEAEVLTGRELNLERARMAALRGDEVTLAREMAQQVGSLAEFESMNVIQRESLAKAFGMNVESMSAMLLRQEAMNKLQGEAKEASDEQLAAARELMKLEGDKFKTLQEATEEIQKRETAQRKFEDAMRKLKTTLTDILSKLDEPLENIAKTIKSMTESPMFKTFAKIGMTLAAAGGIAKLVGSVTGALRGSRFNPMHVVMAGGIPGGTGQDGMGQGRFGQMMSRNLPGGAKYSQAMRLSQAGKYGLSRGMGGAMGLRGAAGGLGLGLLGMGLDYFGNKAEEAGNESLGYGLGIGASAAKGAGTGALIGSFIPVVGTVVGGLIGGAWGALTGWMSEEREDRERAEAERVKREEEKARKEEEARNEQISLFRQLAVKEAKLYMDSNQVGLGLASGNNYAI